MICCFLFLNAFMGYTLNMSFVQRVIGRASSGEEDPSRKVFLYGIAYVAGSAGCNTPIIIALTVFSLVSGGLLLSIVTILTYSSAMWAFNGLCYNVSSKIQRRNGKQIESAHNGDKRGEWISVNFSGRLSNSTIYVFEPSVTSKLSVIYMPKRNIKFLNNEFNQKRREIL